MLPDRMAPPSSSGPGDGKNAALKRSLTLPALLVYGLAYVAPITFFTTYGVATERSGGRLALAYLVATAGILLTALSYGHLARVFPEAGSVYAYASRGIHPAVGFLAGWAIALDYVLIPALNFIIVGIFGQALVPAVPSWVFGLGAVATTTFLNLRGIATTDKAARVILGLELLAIAIFLLAALRAPGEGAPRPPLVPGAVLAGAALVALSFLGFDAITTLSEEARDPVRDVPRAVVFTCVVAGLLFVSAAVVSFRAYPRFHFAHPDVAGFEVAEALGGRALAGLVSVGQIVGSLASALAGQAGAARLLFGMSRDGGLPFPALGRLHPRTRTPDNATLLLAVVGALGLLLPLEQAVALVNFGALLGFFLVNLAVVGHFVLRGRRRDPRALLIHGLLPVLGTLVVAALFLGLETRAKLIGASWLALGVLRLGRRSSGAIS
jgi:amino acid transporter